MWSSSYLSLESLELPLATDGYTVDMLMIRDCIALAGENRPALATAAE